MSAIGPKRTLAARHWCANPRRAKRHPAIWCGASRGR